MTGKDITLGVPSKKRHQDRKTETKLTIQCMHSHTHRRKRSHKAKTKPNSTQARSVRIDRLCYRGKNEEFLRYLISGVRCFTHKPLRHYPPTEMCCTHIHNKSASKKPPAECERQGKITKKGRLLENPQRQSFCWCVSTTHNANGK